MPKASQSCLRHNKTYLNHYLKLLEPCLSYGLSLLEPYMKPYWILIKCFHIYKKGKNMVNALIFIEKEKHVESLKINYYSNILRQNCFLYSYAVYIRDCHILGYYLGQGQEFSSFDALWAVKLQKPNFTYLGSFCSPFSFDFSHGCSYFK